jgi:hypothetical protein
MTLLSLLLALLVLAAALDTATGVVRAVHGRVARARRE